MQFVFFSQDQNSDRASVSSLGALDSESTSLTDEDVCNDFESASPQENTTSEIKGIGLSRTSLESSASHDGSAKQFDQCGKSLCIASFETKIFQFYKLFSKSSKSPFWKIVSIFISLIIRQTLGFGLVFLLIIGSDC